MARNIEGLPIPQQGERICPTCYGTGVNPVKAYMMCPKCNGERVVPKRAGER